MAFLPQSHGLPLLGQCQFTLRVIDPTLEVIGSLEHHIATVPFILQTHDVVMARVLGKSPHLGVQLLKLRGHAL